LCDLAPQALTRGARVFRLLTVIAAHLRDKASPWTPAFAFLADGLVFGLVLIRRQRG